MNHPLQLLAVEGGPLTERPVMFTPELFRAKAAKYGELAKTAIDPDELRELRRREQSFAVLADNEQWLADHHDQTVHADASVGLGEVIAVPVADDKGNVQADLESATRTHASSTGGATQ